MDLVSHSPSIRSKRGPAASRIALLDNYAEVFLAREEGARFLLDTAARPTLLIDARKWFDVFEANDFARVVGIKAQWFTEALRPRQDIWDCLNVALEALWNGERVVLFCEAARHRCFQLLLYLLSPYFPDFQAIVEFVKTKRPVVEPSHLPRLWLRAVSAWLVFKKVWVRKFLVLRRLAVASCRLNMAGA